MAKNITKFTLGLQKVCLQYLRQFQYSKHLSSTAAATGYKPFQTCSAFMGIGPSSFPLVDLRVFYLSEHVHTLTRESVLNKCCFHLQLKSTVILFKLCIQPIVTLLMKIISRSYNIYPANVLKTFIELSGMLSIHSSGEKHH